MWSGVVEQLSPRLRIVVIEHPGHGHAQGESSATVRTLDDLADRVRVVCEAAEVELDRVAGLSLGGMVALRIAIRTPERVRRLALLCTAAHLPPADMWRARAATARQSGLNALSTGALDRWLTTAGRADEALVARVHAMLASVDAESYAQCCEVISGMDLRAQLGAVSARTLVVAADADPSTPPSPFAQELAHGIRHSRLAIVEGAAHVAPLEQPLEVSRLLAEHMGEALED